MLGRLDTLNVGRAQALARAVEEEITESDLSGGTRLGTKTELAAQFSVAASTVNEAIRVLQNRGLVQVKTGPKGGVFVAERSGWLQLSQLVLGFKNSAAAVAEVLAVRDSLEALVDTEAARRHTAADLAELETLLERMEQHVFEPAAYLHHNWDLHRRIAELCQNEFARSLYEGLLDFAESQLADVGPHDSFDGHESLITHRKLVEAIASGDERQVLRAVKKHSSESRVYNG